MTIEEPSEYELEKIGNQLAIPTKDEDVINALRKLGEKLEPSESASQRRRRLLLTSARRHIAGEDPSTQNSDPSGDEHEQEFFSGAPLDLIETRKQILSSSQSAAAKRLDTQIEAAAVYQSSDIETLEASIGQICKQIDLLKSIECRGTESGFKRPVSGVAFWENKLFAGSWSGEVFDVDLDSLQIQSSKQVHSGKVCMSRWRHGLLTGGLEGNIQVGSQTLQSNARVGGIDGHPHLDLVAGGYFDCTFKLWDINGAMLLSQTGHSEEVFSVKFHPDGGLIATAGLDGQVRVWDLRSGKVIMILDKHAKEVYTLDWSSDGYTLATGGSDNSIIVWDIRNKVSRMLPAHTNVVSAIKFAGPTIISGSYDKTVRLWNSQSGSLLATKSIYEKVMSLDFHKDTLAIGKWDRTVDLWGELE